MVTLNAFLTNGDQLQGCKLSGELAVKLPALRPSLSKLTQEHAILPKCF
jgi:hypothetical protein